MAPPTALHMQGQEPLTASMLAEAPPQEQKQMLGERLFPLIHSMYPDMAGKITGMLLEIDNSELLHMLESRESLKAKVYLLAVNKKYVLSNSESVQCNFFIFDHVTFVMFKICCCVQNFIKIG